MQDKHIAALFAGSLLLAGSMMSPAAADPARIDKMTFSAGDTISKIHIISTDGKKWNAIKDGNAQFFASMVLKTKHRDRIHNVGVVLGDCNDWHCLSFPKLWFKTIEDHDWVGTANINFGKANIPLSGANAFAVTPEGNEMLATCNAHLQANGPTKSFAFDQIFRATFVADTNRQKTSDGFDSSGSGIFPAQIDHWKTDSFKVKVVCDAVLKPPTNDIAVAEPEFKATDAKLYLTTFLSNQGGNAASKCRALRVTTRVQTTKAGGVDVRLWRKAGNGPVTSTFHSIWSSYDSEKNGYFADLVKGETFTATTNLQFMAEVVGGTFAPSTPWKDITVHCTGAGGGGLANDMPGLDEDPLPPPKPDKPKPQVEPGANDLAGTPLPNPDGPVASWTGEVTMADSAGTRKHCPRKGQVVFEVKRDEPGSFKYKISCSNGQGFGGTSQSFNKGNGIFEAFGAHDINVNRTRKIQCTLQEVKASGARVTIDKGVFDYTCNNPAIDPSADDITAPPKPTQAEDKPDVSIFCKPGFKLVGKKCVKKPVISILCRQGFTLVGKNCVKKPVVSILCARGFELKGKKCVRKPVIGAAKRLPKRVTIQSPN